jgi:hypothetical protein
MMQSVHLARLHALRAADAIQLACALIACNRAPSHEFIVVGSDQELNADASTEGLMVLDPAQA